LAAGIRFGESDARGNEWKKPSRVPTSLGERLQTHFSSMHPAADFPLIVGEAGFADDLTEERRVKAAIPSTMYNGTFFDPDVTLGNLTSLLPPSKSFVHADS
jgi:hypothetical protein